MFEGNLMEHLNDIKDEATCQLACLHVPGCKYYIYDKDEKDCELMDSDSRQCDLIKVEKRAQGVAFKDACVHLPDAPTSAAPTIKTTHSSTTKKSHLF